MLNSPDPMALVERRLLAEDEPEPLETYRPDAASDFVIVCEHAGRVIPRSLGTLGLAEPDLSRHIAWDIGARPVAMALSDRLVAPLFMQRYSRLVCDCNRRPDVPSFAPEISEATLIPGNRGLSPDALQLRAEAIFHPFHAAVTAALDARKRDGKPTLLITIHTFTPVFKGVARPWEIGVLYHRDPVFAPTIAKLLQENTSLCVGVNQPYAVGDDSDYAIPIHGEARGLPCVEFEIRNDLIGDQRAADAWAALIAETVLAAAAELEG